MTADTVSAGTGHFVEVAIDAAGAGGMRTYTYAVPDDLEDVEAGEAVIVEFGRRRSLAVVLGDATEPRASRRNRSRHECEPTGRCCRPSPSRSRAGSPDTILSRPPGPPGDAPPRMLERLEAVVERTPASAADRGTDVVTLDLLDQLAAGPRPCRTSPRRRVVRACSGAAPRSRWTGL